MMSKKMSRREFLKRSAIVGASAAALPILNACAPATQAPAPAPSSEASSSVSAPAVVKTPGDQFSWPRFKSEKIEALLIKNTQGAIMVQNLKEFQDLTGITVGVD